MKKTHLIFIILAVFSVSAFLFFQKNFLSKKTNYASNTNLGELQSSQANQQTENSHNIENTDAFQSPMDRAGERVTKKPFSIYITPKTSPVQPERFQGYHTGTDFEIFPGELDVDVPVHAVCGGKLLEKKYASGYGGVAVESCQLNDLPITVIYGHLNLASINAKTGDDINEGDILGNLGKAYSAETDGERKHLHLGFHRGTEVNIFGYVNSQGQLSQWINPCLYICQ